MHYYDQNVLSKLNNLQNCDVDLDQEVAGVEQTAPFLLITGNAGSENSQIFICCENDILIIRQLEMLY